jgi:uncharacterized repeat protein (TIGR04138 family)
MSHIRFADEVLERMRERGDQYDERAYLFVLAGIEFLQGRLPQRRHVSGPSYPRSDFALEQYGLLARAVLEHWGIRATEDIGLIVFSLVDVGLLVTQPGDRVEDFVGVYAFDRAFEHEYVWQGVSQIKAAGS